MEWRYWRPLIEKLSGNDFEVKFCKGVEMRAFVTGGTGFVGSAVVRRLLIENHSVVALVRKGADTRQLKGLDIECYEGDLSDEGHLVKGMEGCTWVFHIAALYSFWGYPWQEFIETNVEGTRRVMAAAQQVGAQRVVHTSSIAVFSPPKEGDTCNEDSPSQIDDLVGHYKRSKLLGEDVVREFSRKGLPVVIVNPSAPIGERDWKPTATGKIIVDFINHKMPAYVRSRQNMVDVEDVASGHILAAERGKVGERYILGGENFTLKQFLDLVAEESGLPQVKLCIPFGIALAWSYVDTTIPKLVKSYIPTATPDAVRIGKLHGHFDSSKAIRDLDYSPGPVREAVRKAVEWYRANGYAN
jgi:dihydroflavonol-4-reductase